MSERPRQPWERMDGEPETGYTIFRAYAKQPAGKRSLSAAAKACGVTKSAADKYSRPWKWSQRVAAWDEHLERIETQEIERQKVVMGRLESESLVSLLGTLKNVSRRMLRASKRKDFVIKDLVGFMDSVIKLSRLHRGEAGEHVKVEEASEAKAYIEEQLRKYGEQPRDPRRPRPQPRLAPRAEAPQRAPEAEPDVIPPRTDNDRDAGGPYESGRFGRFA